MTRLLPILLVALQAQAAVYYVRTDGNDANLGTANTAGGAWRHIDYAASTAAAGDTVNVGPGTFNEFVVNDASGSAGNPITFVGTRSGSSWLTIIDPSTAMSSGWVAAPEIGSGVWKHDPGAFYTHELEIGGQRVAYVWTLGDMSADLAYCYTAPGFSTGAQIMALSSAATVTVECGTTPFWDAISALWCCYGSTNYLRLRDGSDPNGLAITVAPNTGTNLWYTGIAYPAVNLNGKSYVTWSNFWVRGAVGGFLLSGGGNNAIASNYLAGGIYRVTLQGGTTLNTVTGNTIGTDFYGNQSGGAWQNSVSATARTNNHRYLLSKYLMGDSSTVDFGVYLQSAGASNSVTGNTFFWGIGSAIGINGNVASPTAGTSILSNSISGQPSIGVMLSYGHTQTRAADNLIADCNLNMRFGEMAAAGESDRTVYVYRNRSYNPTAAGDHILIHFNAAPAGYYPVFWVYQNSYSGGSVGVDMGSSYKISGCSFYNNIWSTPTYFTGNAGFFADASNVGAYNYNLWCNSSAWGVGAWLGGQNLSQAANMWPLGTLPTFTLIAGSIAIDAGMDLPVAYPTLPQDGTVRHGAAWDIGALEYSSPIVPTTITTLRVGSLRGQL